MVSVEWIGKKFQQTPGIEDDVTVVAHSDMNIDHFDVQIDRKFEKLEEIFETLIIEARFLIKNYSDFSWIISILNGTGYLGRKNIKYPYKLYINLKTNITENHFVLLLGIKSTSYLTIFGVLNKSFLT